MKLSERKNQALYKNEDGGKIMVRISLPATPEACDLNLLYEGLSEKYLLAAREFIMKKSLSESLFFNVTYECEEGEKYLKIKRLSTLKTSRRTLKTVFHTDVFEKEGLRLKK